MTRNNRPNIWHDFYVSPLTMISSHHEIEGPCFRKYYFRNRRSVLSTTVVDFCVMVVDAVREMAPVTVLVESGGIVPIYPPFCES